MGAQALTAVRAARPIVDKLNKAERRRVAAVIACVAGPTEQGAAVADMAVSGLSLGESLPLHVSGLGRCGVYTALHVASALVRADPGALVLVVRPGAVVPGGAGVQVGALLAASEGGVACRRLPPARAELPRGAEIGTHDPLYGAALALALARGGLTGRDVKRVVSPGASFADSARLLLHAGLEHLLAPSCDTRMSPAATLEQAIAAALQTPPDARTLLWERDVDGSIGACLLEPD